MTDRILYERDDPLTSRRTEVVIDNDTGLPLIVRYMDTKPIVESAKQLASNFDKHRKNPHGVTHVARIDINTWAQLTRLGITRDEKAFNVWLDSREAMYFRCDDRRKL